MIKSFVWVVFLLVAAQEDILASIKSTNAFELLKIHCSKKHMQADFMVPHDDVRPNVYLHDIRNELWKRCHPLLHSRSPLEDFYKCNWISDSDKLNRSLDLHHEKPFFSIACKYRNKKHQSTMFHHRVVRRDALPDGFREDTDIDILETLEENAPEPKVAIDVRQNGQLVNDTVTVIPGTPLVLEIRLDNSASNVYGTSVKFVEASNGAENSETIVFRGCSVDPYLFENFVRTRNNTLQANFRAFKFPNTAFVQFRINVQICLKKCPVIHCLNGQGRSKREVSTDYEISLGLKLRVGGFNKENEEQIRMTENHVKLLQMKKLKLQKVN